MKENNNKTGVEDIDLLMLFRKIWDKRRLVYKVCGIAAVIAIVAAFSIPKEYTTKVILAPEVNNKSGLSGSMGALASMAGLNLGGGGGEDAIFPELYPKIMQSTPFLTEMFDVKVTDSKGKLNTTLYDYLQKHQKQPWWGYILGLPKDGVKWIISLFAEKEDDGHDKKANPFRLTSDQAAVAGGIKNMIKVSVDKKTDVVTFSVSSQDPLVSAIVADSVMGKLQEYVTDYRTKKARKDLLFAEKLYNESKKNYLERQKEYATFSDRNIDLIFATYKAEEERLKNEQNLAYNVYNQMAQQLQVAKAKVQEQTPVFSVVQPPTVALLASSPKKFFLLAGFVFLAFVSVSAYILIKDKLKK